MRVAGRCFHDWLAQRGGIEPAEELNATAQVRHFIERHGASRPEPINDGREHAEARVPEAWKADICTGMDAAFVTRTLAQRGFLKVGSLYPVFLLFPAKTRHNREIPCSAPA